MKYSRYQIAMYRIEDTRIKEIYKFLCESSEIGEDNGEYLFGYDSNESFLWKKEYINNYDLFCENVNSIKEKWFKVIKMSKDNIQTEKVNNIYYHIDECKTSFYYMIFYKIITINNIKYLRMEFVTVPGYKNDDEYSRIKYISLSQEMVSMGRKSYFKHRIENTSPLITSESDREQNLDNNQVDLRVVLRHDLYNNIRDILENGIPGSCSTAEAFYFCDSMINNDGKGRKELNIFDLTTETEDGDYFCYGFDRNYEYNVEHDFELLDSEPTLLDYLS